MHSFIKCSSALFAATLVVCCAANSANAQSCSQSDPPYTDSAITRGSQYETVAYYVDNRLSYFPTSGSSFGASSNISRSEAAKVIAMQLGYSKASCSSPKFNDISSDTNCGYIQALANHGIVSGDGTGKFRPSDNLIRSEAATLIVNMKGYSLPSTSTQTFSDVPSTKWYHPYIESLVKNCIVQGDNGSFYPETAIKKIDFAALIVRATVTTSYCDNGVYQTCSNGSWKSRTCSDICHPAEGGCAECHYDCDCGSDEKCNNGYCEPQQECTPYESECSDSYNTRTCSRSGMWGSETYCDFGCNVRTGECKECQTGDTKCSGLNYMLTCIDGQWDDKTSCPNGCTGNACNEDVDECMNGQTRCESSSYMQTCTNGQWGKKEYCSNGCVNKSCVEDTDECMNSQTRCMDADYMQTCINGRWNDNTYCEYGCLGNACVTDGCTTGSKRCNGNELQKCSDNTWSTFEICSAGCDSKNVVCKTAEACTGDQTRCDSSNLIIEKCSGSLWTTYKVCNEDTEKCQNGACVPKSQNCSESDNTCDEKTWKHCVDNKLEETSCKHTCDSQKGCDICPESSTSYCISDSTIVTKCTDKVITSTATCPENFTCTDGKCVSSLNCNGIKKKCGKDYSEQDIDDSKVLLTCNSKSKLEATFCKDSCEDGSCTSSAFACSEEGEHFCESGAAYYCDGSFYINMYAEEDEEYEEFCNSSEEDNGSHDPARQAFSSSGCAQNGSRNMPYALLIFIPFFALLRRRKSAVEK